MKRGLATVVVLLAVASGATAQPPPEAEAVKFTLRPAAAPSQVLKYDLLPALKDQSPGNAASVYYRALSPEWWGFIRQPETWEKIAKAGQVPLKELSRQEVGWVLNHNMLREVDRAARREFVDWEITDRLRMEGIALLLPDVQALRDIGTLLAVRARLEIAAGDFDKAIYTLQTGFALARHLTEGPTLIQALVGVATANAMLASLEDLLQQPGAPNLYWSLTALPRPFIDLHKGLQGEKLSLYGTFPMLRDIETVPLPARDQQTLLKALGSMGADGVLDYGPKPAWTDRFVAISFVLRAYPEAKRALIAEGRKPQEVEALPALQVVILHSLHQYLRLQDNLFKCYELPFWEIPPYLEEASREIKQAKAEMAAWPFIELIPAIQKVLFATPRVDRRIAALRCIEALRLYAAAHDGKLPAALSDVKQVLIPLDPVTGKAFDYRASGARATLTAPPPPGETPSTANTIHYELTLQR